MQNNKRGYQLSDEHLLHKLHIQTHYEHLASVPALGVPTGCAGDSDNQNKIRLLARNFQPRPDQWGMHKGIPWVPSLS